MGDELVGVFCPSVLFMDQILRQLGELALGSLPTIVFFLLLLAAYSLLVRRPLDRVLAERRARTSGAIEQARGAITAAEAETAVFEDKLRNARRELFEARERMLKQWNSERDLALEQARSSTQQKVRVAREGVEQNAVTARQQIESMSEELSAQILKAVLPSSVTAREVSQ